MKLLIKLAITALIANAAWRLGSEYLSYFKFRDAVREAAIYQAKTDDELRKRVAALASDYDLPVDADAMTIRHDGRQTFMEGVYVKPVELFPGFPYAWRFEWAIDFRWVSSNA